METNAPIVESNVQFAAFISYLQNEYWSDDAGSDPVKQAALKAQCLEIINQLEEYAYS